MRSAPSDTEPGAGRTTADDAPPPSCQKKGRPRSTDDLPRAGAPSKRKPASAASRGNVRDERPPGCARIVLNLPNPAGQGARVAPRSNGYRREKPGPGRRLRGSRPTRSSNPSPVYVGPPPVRHDVSRVQGTPPAERRHDEKKGGCHGPRRRRNPVRRRSARSAASDRRYAGNRRYFRVLLHPAQGCQQGESKRAPEQGQERWAPKANPCSQRRERPSTKSRRSEEARVFSSGRRSQQTENRQRRARVSYTSLR